jgi:hypothetical protein
VLRTFPEACAPLPLRWINAELAKSFQIGTMQRIKAQLPPAAALQAQSNTVRDTAAGQVGLATVKAAWPSGVSPLAQAVDACQRRDARETALVARAPDSIVLPAVFSPSGRFFAR